MSTLVANAQGLLEKVPTTDILEAAVSLSGMVISTAGKAVPFVESLLVVIEEVEKMNEKKQYNAEMMEIVEVRKDL